MSAAFIALGPGSRLQAEGGRQIALGKLVKSGGAGSVYLLPDAPTQVAKIYHDAVDLALYERKIQAMLRLAPDLPDLQDGDARITQIAWPQALLRDSGRRFRGFLMPRLPLDDTAELEYMLQERQARAAGLPVGLGARVTLAANASAVVAELHRRQHFVVDLKPVNIRFYRRSLHLAMLDCDGFSINGDLQRYEAPQYTPDYLAPEFHRHHRLAGHEAEQDRFALAVLIFQLLNFGIHPYSGRPINDQVPTDIPGRIAGRYYAYGLHAHPRMQPNPSSGHAQIPATLRTMFDRAFSATGQARPTALEWSQALAPYALRSSGRLIVCARNREHQYFAGMQCAACARAQLIARAATRESQAPAPRRTGRASPPRQPASPPPQAAAPKGLGAALGTFLGILLFTVIALVAIPWHAFDAWLSKHAPAWRWFGNLVVIAVLASLAIGWFSRAGPDKAPIHASVGPSAPSPALAPAFDAPKPVAHYRPGGFSDDASYHARQQGLIESLLATVAKRETAEFVTQFSEIARLAPPADRVYVMRHDPWPSIATGNDAAVEYRPFVVGELLVNLARAENDAPQDPAVLNDVGFARLMLAGNLGSWSEDEYDRLLHATRRTYLRAIAAGPSDYAAWHGLGIVCAAMPKNEGCAEAAFAISRYLEVYFERRSRAVAASPETSWRAERRSHFNRRLAFCESALFQDRSAQRLRSTKGAAASVAYDLDAMTPLEWELATLSD